MATTMKKADPVTTMNQKGESSIKIEKVFRKQAETDYQYLNARFFCIDELRVRDSWRIPRHEHNCYELIVCRSGAYECIVDKQPVAIKKGQALLVRSGAWHEDTSTRRGELTFVKFYIVGSSAVGGGTTIFNADASANRFVISYPQELTNLIEKIESSAATKEPFASLIQDSQTLALFWIFCERLPQSVFSKKFSSALTAQPFEMRLSKLFAQSMYGNLPVETIASELAMSISVLERTCRREMKMSPAKAWATLRMNEALRMIRHSNMSIKEISENLAFSHQNHFTNAFTRHFGKPPTYYRTHGYPGLLYDKDRTPQA